MSAWLELRVRAEKQCRESMPKRGLINTAANAHFKSLKDGTSTFYPQGALGRCGFIISTTEQEMLLRRSSREYRKGLSIAQIILSIAFAGFFRRMEFWQHMTWIAGFSAMDWVAARIYFRRFTRKMEPADGANSPVAYWRSMGQTMHPVQLILTTIMSVGFIGACFYFLVLLREPILLLMCVLMTAGLAVHLIALRSWWRARSV